MSSLLARARRDLANVRCRRLAAPPSAALRHFLRRRRPRRGCRHVTISTAPEPAEKPEREAQSGPHAGRSPGADCAPCVPPRRPTRRRNEDMPISYAQSPYNASPHSLAAPSPLPAAAYWKILVLSSAMLRLSSSRSGCSGREVGGELADIVRRRAGLRAAGGDEGGTGGRRPAALRVAKRALKSR